MNGSVLVVEDDHAIRRGITDALKFEGYTVFEAADGTTGQQRALTLDCDLVLLDLNLPGRDGLEILKEIRRARPVLSVIILTARGAEPQRIEGLKLGADDYVVKPFSVKELLARVEAVLRRMPDRPTDVARWEFTGGTVDFERFAISYDDGGAETLSEKEGELLRYLVVNAGRVISRDEILSRVWRMDPRGVATRTVDMHMARLRDKLRSPDWVRTVRGKGYVLEAQA